MTSNQPGENLDQEIKQFLLNNLTVGGNFTLGNITQQNITQITQIFLNGLPLQQELTPHQQELIINWISLHPEEFRAIAGTHKPPETHEVPSPSSTSSWNTKVEFPPPSTPIISTFEFEVVKVDVKGRVTSRCCQQAQYFTESLGNTVELEMVCIPDGKFLMGAPEQELETMEDERPQHLVTVRPFSMSKYPITQAQWRAIAILPKITRDLNTDPSYFKGDQYPVERVSWHDALEFCHRLSNKTGREYRIPSEAEWERGCRARTTTPFHFGETITTDIANYCGQDRKIKGRLFKGTYVSEPAGVYREQTTAVGSFPANAFGLCDMHGNVWEWCADYQHKNYQDAPSDDRIWLDNGNDAGRILRGGSWDSHPSLCRSASRSLDNPSTRKKQTGFRVACFV